MKVEEKSMQAPERICTRRSLICETPVSIYQDQPLKPNAPKKSMVFLCRTQQPPPGSLQEEWSLEPYGMRGRWGYVFKYETGDLCLYQLGSEDEKLGPLATAGMLTSNDWGVLKLAIPRHSGGGLGSAEEALTVKEEPEEAPATPAAKRLRLESPPDDVELTRRRMVFTAVWQSKTGVTGRWFFRAGHRKSNENEDGDLFVLDCFNSDCGVFRTLLAIPHAAWVEKMNEIADRVSTLFRSCQNWAEILAVKKTLAL